MARDYKWSRCVEMDGAQCHKRTQYSGTTSRTIVIISGQSMFPRGRLIHSVAAATIRQHNASKRVEFSERKSHTYAGD